MNFLEEKRVPLKSEGRHEVTGESHGFSRFGPSPTWETLPSAAQL